MNAFQGTGLAAPAWTRAAAAPAHGRLELAGRHRGGRLPTIGSDIGSSCDAFATREPATRPTPADVTSL